MKNCLIPFIIVRLVFVEKCLFGENNMWAADKNCIIWLVKTSEKGSKMLKSWTMLQYPLWKKEAKKFVIFILVFAC